MLDPNELPPRQFQAFQIVSSALEPVPLRVIAEKLGISRTTAERHIYMLIKKGFLTRKNRILVVAENVGQVS